MMLLNRSVCTIVARTRVALNAALQTSEHPSRYRIPCVDPDSIVLWECLGGVARPYWTSLTHEAVWAGRRVGAKTYEFCEDGYARVIAARIVRTLSIPAFAVGLAGTEDAHG